MTPTTKTTASKNTLSLTRRGFLASTVALAAALAFPDLSQAQTAIMSAPEAQAAVDAGEMVLLDIRTREEWLETGVAEGAWPVSMHTPQFGPELSAILQRFSDRKIGLICATGGRTAYVVDILEKNGIKGVIDVSEGMLGNPRGPGWVARKLPIVDLDTAMTIYTQAVSQ